MMFTQELHKDELGQVGRLSPHFVVMCFPPVKRGAVRPIYASTMVFMKLRGSKG